MSSKERLEINTLEDLQAAKIFLKMRVKQHERDLAERYRRLPVEVIKSTAGTIIPFFLNNKVAGATFQLLKAALGMFFRKKASSNENIKETIVSSAKNWGFVTLAKALYGIFSK